MAWSYSTIHCRLMRDTRMFHLTDRQSNVLFRLYMACDAWGRVEVDEMSLRVLLGLVKGGDVVPVVHELGSKGFLKVYQVGSRTLSQMDRYDTDIPSELARKRGPSEYPSPDEATSHLDYASDGNDKGKDAVRNTSGTYPDAIRTPSGTLPDPIPPILDQTRPDQTRPDRSSRGAQPPPPLTPKLPHWPPGCEEAARMYLYRQEQVASTAMISDAMLINVAKDWPDEFSSAVKRIVSLSGDKGKAAFTRNPEKWLRLRCGWIKEDKAKAKKEGKDKPREQAGDAPKPFRGTDCHWYKPKDETRQMREIPPAELLPNLAIMSLKGETKQRRPPTPVTSFPEGLKYWEDHGREFYQSCHDKWIAKGSKPHVPFDDGRSAVAS